MPRLILRLDGRVLKRCPLGPVVTIGRLPDNAIAIDNAAISGHHACVIHEGRDFVLEDLQSTNGTFVNERRVTRHMLQDGDVVTVGNHTLVFEAGGRDTVDETAPAERIVSNPGDTVFLDADKHQALLAMLQETAAEPNNASRVGVLRVVEGRADESEYHLQAHTSVIGKADTSLIRLKGWFIPQVAVVITRNGPGYTATHMKSSAQINGAPLTGRHDLKEGDVLRVGGLTLEFRYD